LRLNRHMRATITRHPDLHRRTEGTMESATAQDGDGTFALRSARTPADAILGRRAWAATPFGT
jgi:hypothetical protein